MLLIEKTKTTMSWDDSLRHLHSSLSTMRTMEERERQTRPCKSREMDEMSPNEESSVMEMPTDSVEARRETRSMGR